MASLEAYHPRLQVTKGNEGVYQRNLQPVSAELNKEAPELAREVMRIKAKGKEEQRIYNLEGTGFHVAGQVRLLVDNYKKGIPLSDSISQIEQDTNGFNVEYLREAPVFAIPLALVQRDGEKKVVGKLYGEKLWEDSTDEIEREGVVKESVKKIAKGLSSAKPGTTFMFHSGEGWSNYQAKGGELEQLNRDDVANGVSQEVNYPDSQTYIITVNRDGSLTAVTLKAHMSLSQSEEFVARLKGQEKPETAHLSEKVRIKQVAGNVLEFSPKDNINAKSIAKVMKHMLGNTAYIDSLGRARTFDEMFFMLQNPESLEKLDEVTKKLSQKFADFTKWRLGFLDDDVSQDLQIALGHTILKLMHETRGGSAEQILVEGGMHTVHKPESLPFDPRAILQEMQKLPGCAGGGIKVDSAGAPRAGVLGQDSHGSSEVVCPDCGRVNKRMPGQLLPKCGATLCQSKTIACEPVKITSQEKSEGKVTSIQKKPAQTAKKAA